MFLGPHLTCMLPNAGCVEILGSRSSNSAVALVIAAGVFEAAARGKIVGRRGVSDVNDLEEMLD